MAGSAGIAQLVEHDLAKVGVASSSLVSRSSFNADPPAGWQSGYAADCKSAYAGSIPTPASRFEKPRLERGFFVPAFSYHGRDGPDGETGRRKGLKIPRPQGHVGSIPTPGTRCVYTVRTLLEVRHGYRRQAQRDRCGDNQLPRSPGQEGAHRPGRDGAGQEANGIHARRAFREGPGSTGRPGTVPGRPAPTCRLQPFAGR